MTFGHLYSSALDQELGTDDSTRLFTSARRKRAVNRGIQEFCDLTNCLVRQRTITLTNGTGEYDLNSTTVIAAGDFLRLAPQMPEYHLLSSGSSKSTVFTAGNELFPRRDIPWLNEYDGGWRSTTVGTPEAFYFRADGGQYFIGLAPPPNITSSQTGRLIFPYIAKPSSMSSDTDVPFTLGSTYRGDLEPYHQAAVHYAAYQLEKLRRDMEASQMQLKQFLGFVERYKRQVEPIGPQQIRLGRNYFQEVRRRAHDRWNRTSIPLGNLTP